MAPRIEWYKCPKEVRDAVEPILLTQLHLLPPWVYELLVTFDSKDAENRAKTLYQVEYRDVKLTICAGYLTDTPDQRLTTIVHELFHAHIEPLRDLAMRLVVEYLEDAEKNVMEEQVRLRVEGVISDLTETLRRDRLENHHG